MRQHYFQDHVNSCIQHKQSDDPEMLVIERTKAKSLSVRNIDRDDSQLLTDMLLQTHETEYVFIEAIQDHETEKRKTGDNSGILYEISPPMPDINDNTSTSTSSQLSRGDTTSEIFVDSVDINHSYISDIDESLLYNSSYVDDVGSSDDETTDCDISLPISPPKNKIMKVDSSFDEDHISRSEIIVDYPPAYDLVTPYSTDKQSAVICYSDAEKSTPTESVVVHKSLTTSKIQQSSRLAYYRHHEEEIIITRAGIDKTTQTHVTINKRGVETLTKGDLMPHCYNSAKRTARYLPGHDTIDIVHSEYAQSGRDLEAGRPQTFLRQASVMASQKFKVVVETVDKYTVPIITISILLLLFVIALIVMGAIFPLT